MANHDEAAIENEIQRKGLNAPRLNPAHIDAQIVEEAFYVFPGTTLTVCALTLRNTFIVIGESRSGSDANFDEELGRKIARDNARSKIWALEGYLLRSKLAMADVDENMKRRAAAYEADLRSRGPADDRISGTRPGVIIGDEIEDQPETVAQAVTRTAREGRINEDQPLGSCGVRAPRK